MELFKKIFVFLLITVTIDYSSACNGYKMTMIKLENTAGDDAVLKIDPDTTVSMTKDCEIVVKGCAETKDFNTATVKYTILKNGNRITSGSTDVCEELKKDTKGIATGLMSFGLPKSCPIKKMKQCADGSQKISIASHKNLLPLAAGTIDMTIDVTHDTGKSGMKCTLKISR
ncbi:uncharacterized protein LOC116340881 [Contarinia nasturtii]|uniref:uncharacterized protein LOC116340881 n=1 Tax=Contarinia nasturtii TaxID=265458 RepID=UPI0012D487DF|nr:uncharacterized protein LOC116340881 [Contarinia nasturtii]